MARESKDWCQCHFIFSFACFAFFDLEKISYIFLLPMLCKFKNKEVWPTWSHRVKLLYTTELVFCRQWRSQLALGCVDECKPYEDPSHSLFRNSSKEADAAVGKPLGAPCAHLPLPPCCLRVEVFICTDRRDGGRSKKDDRLEHSSPELTISPSVKAPEQQSEFFSVAGSMKRREFSGDGNHFLGTCQCKLSIGHCPA